MSPSQLMRLTILPCGAALALASTALGQTNLFSPGGPDYAIAGALPGDQAFPQSAINAAGGYLVWEDNAADGSGTGIRAERLNAGLHKSGVVYPVNTLTAADQQKPQVALLTDGGAVFVWQGGNTGFQKIFARFQAANGTFLTSDIQVNAYTNEFQANPSVATLADGSVVVVWGSYGQDGSRQGIYGQRLSAAGVKLGGEFQINQFTLNNQRTPAVAALTNGNFVVAWVSELQRNASSVDIYARIFGISNSLPYAVSNEFVVNTSSSNVCANPQLAASPLGGFAVGWSQNATMTRAVWSPSETGPATISGGFNSPSGWDVLARVFNSNGSAASDPAILNTWTDGDQFAPKISAFGPSYLVVWTSLGQDTSWEGVFGQFLTSGGSPMGVEFRVNTTTVSKQIHPSVASDGANRFLVCWSSFVAGTSFDLFARSYELIRVIVTTTAGGVTVSWNTQPGLVYQLQTSMDYSSWTNVGSPLTAAGFSQSVNLSVTPGGASYRVIRIQ